MDKVNFDRNTIENIYKCPILSYFHVKKVLEYNMTSCVTLSKIVNDVRLLVNNGYTSLSLKELSLCISGEMKWPNNPFCIIFEGGYLSFYDLVFPIFKDYNIKANLFIPVDFVGMEKHPDYPSFIPHYSWNHMNEMLLSGLIEIYGSWHITDKDKGNVIDSYNKNKNEIVNHVKSKFTDNFFIYNKYDEEAIIELCNNNIKPIIKLRDLDIPYIKLGCLGKIEVCQDTDLLNEIDSLTNGVYEKYIPPFTVINNIDIIEKKNEFLSYNKESIKLKVEDNPPLKNYMRTAFPLSVIFADKKYKYNNFLLNNFIDIISIPDQSHLDYHNYNYIDWPCIKASKLLPDYLIYNNINILISIFTGLKRGYYSDIWVDCYYIPGKSHYKNNHQSHGLLIYGYDNEVNEFLALTYKKDGKYGRINIKPENILESITNDYFLGLTQFKRNDTARIEYDLKKIRNKLYNYINSIVEDSDSIKFHKEYPNHIYGYNAIRWFNKYLNDIYTNSSKLNLVTIYTFYEHTKNMVFRIKEIISRENYNISYTIENIDLLEKKSREVLDLVTKFILKKDNALIHRAAQYSDIIVKEEYNIISELIKHIDYANTESTTTI